MPIISVLTFEQNFLRLQIHHFHCLFYAAKSSYFGFLFNYLMFECDLFLVAVPPSYHKGLATVDIKCVIQYAHIGPGFLSNYRKCSGRIEDFTKVQISPIIILSDHSV